MLCLIFLLSFEQFNEIFVDSFSEAGFISKDTGIWSIAIYLFFKSLEPQRILSKTTNLFDLSFLVLILTGISISESEHSVLIPTILFSSIWFFSAKSGNFPSIFITWLYLLLSLPYSFYTLVIPELQSLVVNVLEGIIGILGIPVLVQENFITIPRGQFAVEEGCSGLKFLSVNLVLLFLYSVLSKFNLRQFLLAFAITLIISLILNWIRILLIIVTAHNWGFDVPYLVKDHADFGWVIYTLFLIPMFYLYHLIDKIRFGTIFNEKFRDFVTLPVPAITFLIPILLFSFI